MSAPRSASSKQSLAVPAAANLAAPTPATTPVSSYFVRERERIITEIADGMEQLLGNVNTLNRKLEESVVVGQEFEPIANLWGPFVNMLTSNGITPEPRTQGDAAAAAAAATTGTPAHARSRSTASATAEDAAAVLRESVDGPIGTRLPPGVAPGGGTVYGMPPTT